ncbi:hypothetical protein C8Q79DRAFT_1009400 [Trametes meyenii]|nr:hypothetical protein C8Q79DRAFT_1009400 [Trametes meyenii]
MAPRSPENQSLLSIQATTTPQTDWRKESALDKAQADLEDIGRLGELEPHRPTEAASGQFVLDLPLVSKEQIEALHSRIVTLELELTLLKAQRATDRSRIDQCGRELAAMRKTSQDICARLQQMTQMFEDLEARRTWATQRRTKSDALLGASLLNRIGSIVGECPTVRDIMRLSVSWLSRNVAFPQADIYAWLVFGLYSIVAVLYSSTRPQNHEYPLWAMLDV